MEIVYKKKLIILFFKHSHDTFLTLPLLTLPRNKILELPLTISLNYYYQSKQF